MSKSIPNLVVLRVHRNDAGVSIPFDKVYFARREDRPLIPRVFGFAMVLPVDDKLVTAIYMQRAKHITYSRFRRDDDAVRVPTGVDGRKMNKQQIQEWWEKEIMFKHDVENRVAVIPILTSRIRKRIHPRYLSSKNWFARQETGANTTTSRRGNRTVKEIDTSKLVPALSDMAYLATPFAAPADIIRPLCSECPRSLLHMQGKCIPGQNVCYKALDFNKIVAESVALIPEEHVIPENMERTYARI